MPVDRHFAGLPGCTGEWKKIGRAQFDFLAGEGLKPGDYVLDAGCGTLRGGRLLIDYLEPARYFGIDKNANLILRGIRNTLIPKELIAKLPTFYAVELGPKKVDLPTVLGRRWFNYVWAHALFDHMPRASIRQALQDIEPVLGKDRALYATAFIVENDRKPEKRKNIVTYPDRDPWHQTRAFYKKAANDAGLELAPCPEYKHPLGLKMLKFCRG